MRHVILSLLAFTIVAGCSASAHRTPVDPKLLAAVEQALGPEQTQALRKASHPLELSISGDDRVLAQALVGPDDPVDGPADAPVTIVVFSDFQCPFCGRHAESLAQVRKTWGDLVRVVFRQFPLAFHVQARPAARASLAAGRQGRFWPMHDLLFANGRALSAEAYGRWAAGLGLDAGRFEEDFASPSVDDQVARDLAAGEKLGVTGTPTAFINGVRLVGSVPYEAVDELVRLGLGRAAVLLRQGVAPEKIYETLLRQEAPAAGRPPR